MKITVEREGEELVGRVVLSVPHKVILLRQKLLEVVAEGAEVEFVGGRFFKTVRGSSFEELERRAMIAQKRLRREIERVLQLQRIVEVVVQEEMEALKEESQTKLPSSQPSIPPDALREVGE